MKEEGGKMKVEAVGWVERSEAHQSAGSCRLGLAGVDLLSRASVGLAPLDPPYKGQRRGMSLLEVLIGVGVLSVGLLALAMLIPAGRFAIVEAGKADRSGACGRAGLQEVKIQRMLEAFQPAVDDPNHLPIAMWLQVTDEYFALDGATNLDTMGPVCIDPYGIALAAQRQAQGDTTNYEVGFMETFPAGATPAVAMPRVTLRTAPMLNGIGSRPLILADAQQIFVWHDDLLFTLPEQADLRPQAPDVDNNGTPDPPEPEGRYSWMVTLIPAPTDVGRLAQDRQLFTVSIVVFFNRDPVKDAEQVYAVTNFFGSGLGGGSVQITWPPPQQQPEVKEDEWVMLCSQQPATFGGTFKWYRVLSVGQDPDNNRTNLTLAGPDWDVSLPTPQVVVVRGVVGVYTKTVELNENSLWTR